MANSVNSEIFFASNIKLLRKRKGRTQEEMAFILEMKRPTLGGYENGVAQPNMNALIVFSNYFNIAIDTLLRIDLSKLSESELYQIENGLNSYLTGSNLRILFSTVDSNNKDNIELISEKAQAGYTKSFGDPRYINELPVFSLPFLSSSKKYRTFQIIGDSMLPIPDKSYVTGEFVQDWNDIKSNELYIIVTKENGILFKEVVNQISSSKKLQLISKNSHYHPYYIQVNDLKEVWKFVHYISSDVPESYSNNEIIAKNLALLQSEVDAIKARLK